MRVRQDEGGPKFLNDASAAFPAGVDTAQDHGAWRLAQATQFGGGFGYVLDSDGTPLLTTYYTGEQNAGLAGCSERRFGTGYATMRSASANFSAEHTVAVPPGDDPVVLVEVCLTNNGQHARTIRWAEVWSSFMVHLDLKELRNTDRRSFTARHYDSTFQQIGMGALHRRRWKALDTSEKEVAQAYLEGLQRTPRSLTRHHRLRSLSPSTQRAPVLHRSS